MSKGLISRSHDKQANINVQETSLFFLHLKTILESYAWSSKIKLNLSGIYLTFSTKPLISKASAETFVITPWKEKDEHWWFGNNKLTGGDKKRRTFSVIIPVIRFAGVTSNAGFQTEIPGAATCFPSPPSAFSNSFGDLSSTMMSSPDGSERSIEVTGAAT